MENELKQLLADLKEKQANRIEKINVIRQDIKRAETLKDNRIKRFESEIQEDVDSGLYMNTTEGKLKRLIEDEKNKIINDYEKDNEELNQKLGEAQKQDEKIKKDEYNQIRAGISDYHYKMGMESIKAENELKNIKAERENKIKDIDKKISEKEEKYNHLIISNRNFMNIETTKNSLDIKQLRAEIDELNNEKSTLNNEYDNKIAEQEQYIQECDEKKSRAAKFISQINISTKSIEEIQNILFEDEIEPEEKIELEDEVKPEEKIELEEEVKPEEKIELEEEVKPEEKIELEEVVKTEEKLEVDDEINLEEKLEEVVVKPEDKKELEEVMTEEKLEPEEVKPRKEVNSKQVAELIIGRKIKIKFEDGKTETLANTGKYLKKLNKNNQSKEAKRTIRELNRIKSIYNVNKVDDIVLLAMVQGLDKEYFKKKDIAKAINAIENKDRDLLKTVLPIKWDKTDLSKGAFLPWNRKNRDNIVEIADKNSDVMECIGKYEPNPFRRFSNNLKRLITVDEVKGLTDGSEKEQNKPEVEKTKLNERDNIKLSKAYIKLSELVEEISNKEQSQKWYETCNKAKEQGLLTESEIDELDRLHAKQVAKLNTGKDETKKEYAQRRETQDQEK